MLEMIFTAWAIWFIASVPFYCWALKDTEWDFLGRLPEGVLKASIALATILALVTGPLSYWVLR